MRTFLSLIGWTVVAATAAAQDRPAGRARPWVYNHIADYTRANALGPADLAAVEANLLKLVALIEATPVLSPPKGFDIRFTGSIDPADAGPEPRSKAALYDLEYANLDVIGKASATGKVSYFPNHGLEFFVNAPSRLLMFSIVNDAPFAMRTWHDEKGTFLTEPPREEFHGLPYYPLTNQLVVARPGIDPWTPVTVARFGKVFLEERRKASADAETSLKRRAQAYQDAISPETVERHRTELAAASPETAKRLEGQFRRMAADLMAEATVTPNDPKSRWYYEPKAALQAAEAAVASLDATAPACVTGNVRLADYTALRLVAPGTPGCSRIVEPNYAAIDNRLPKAAIQFIVVEGLASCRRTLAAGNTLELSYPGGCIATVAVAEQLDWERVSALIGR